jgi:hypothetical protein
MSDASTPDGDKSIEELKAELDEVADEIAEARQEVEAEHPKRPTFIEGDEDE